MKQKDQKSKVEQKLERLQKADHKVRKQQLEEDEDLDMVPERFQHQLKKKYTIPC